MDPAQAVRRQFEFGGGRQDHAVSARFGENDKISRKLSRTDVVMVLRHVICTSTGARPAWP